METMYRFPPLKSEYDQVNRGRWMHWADLYCVVCICVNLWAVDFLCGNVQSSRTGWLCAKISFTWGQLSQCTLVSYRQTFTLCFGHHVFVLHLKDLYYYWSSICFRFGNKSFCLQSKGLLMNTPLITDLCAVVSVHACTHISLGFEPILMSRATSLSTFPSPQPFLSLINTDDFYCLLKKCHFITSIQLFL